MSNFAFEARADLSKGLMPGKELSAWLFMLYNEFSNSVCGPSLSQDSGISEHSNSTSCRRLKNTGEHKTGSFKIHFIHLYTILNLNIQTSIHIYMSYTSTTECVITVNVQKFVVRITNTTYLLQGKYY